MSIVRSRTVADGAVSAAAAVVLAVAAAGPAVAQNPPARQAGLSAETRARVDAVFTRFDGTTPGCALGVIQAGELVHARGFGLASLEHDVPIRPGSIFHVASVSKQFTVAAIALLDLDGKLSLDDDVRRHLPELPDFGRTITIRHLIHHTSGLRDQWELLTMAGWRAGDPKTERDILELVTRQRDLNFEPGERYLYSNTGYTLMAVIVERVTGRSLRAFADERIFGPLGMRSTHFHNDHTEVVRGRVNAYVRRPDDSYRLSMPIYDNIGATSLNTTVEDLARWDRNFYEPVVGGPALLDVLHRRGVLNDGDTIAYAGALMYGRQRGLPTIGHSGSDAGFRAQLVRFPDERLTVTVLCNVADSNPAALAQQVADELLAGRFAADAAASPGSASPPRPPSFVPPQLSDAELAAYAGSYYSPELDVTWWIALEGDGLVLRRRRFADVPLRPVAGDAFRAQQTLRFTRDDAERVTGFTASGSRVLNLRFERNDE
jgi:CubicO group peptidase (beta-lactamase class C family)